MKQFIKKGGEKNIKQIFLKVFTIVAFVAITSVSAQPAFAAPPTGTPAPKPGWGHGDKNHVHTGPPGHSVRVNSQVNIGTSVNIVAAAGAKVVVNIFNNIVQSFHIGA